MQQIKLENGEIPQDIIEWWSGIYNKTNIFEDGKNCLKARLEKRSIAHKKQNRRKPNAKNTNWNEALLKKLKQKNLG